MPPRTAPSGASTSRAHRSSTLGAGGVAETANGSTIALVSVGSASLVFAVDTSGGAHQYTSGSGWQVLGGPPSAALADISCGSDGWIAGVDVEDGVYVYYGALLALGGRQRPPDLGRIGREHLGARRERRSRAIGGRRDRGGRRASGVATRLHQPPPRWDVEDPFDENARARTCRS